MFWRRPPDFLLPYFLTFFFKLPTCYFSVIIQMSSSSVTVVR